MSASLVEALQTALDQLATATKASSAEGQFDARLALFDVFVQKAMVAEAVEELEACERLLPGPGDLARLAAFRARSATTALLRGEYSRADKLVAEDPEGLWFQGFLLRRDLGRYIADDVASTRKRLQDHAGNNAQLLALAMRASGPDAYAELFRHTGQLAVVPELGSAGPVDRYLGLIAASEGRLDDAQRHLDAAVRVADRNDLLPWAARARADVANVLAERGRAGDAELAAQTLAAAQRTALEIGLVDLLTDKGQPATKPNVFRRDGEFWTISFGGSTFSLRDSKGLVYLASLLAAPDREIHSLELVRGASRDAASNEVARVDPAAAADFTSDPFTGGGEVIDAEAREDYRRRLADIDAEIAQATDWNDPERVARLSEERDFLIRELAGAVGLGGVTRSATSASERARISVTKAIWSSVDRISTHGPELGRHLTLTVHTGTFCSYTPDPALKIVWEL